MHSIELVVISGGRRSYRRAKECSTKENTDLIGMYSDRINIFPEVWLFGMGHCRYILTFMENWISFWGHCILILLRLCIGTLEPKLCLHIGFLKGMELSHVSS
jgi:hypothetical protein